MSFSFGTAAQQPAASGGFGGFGQPATSTPAAAGGFGSFGQTSTAPTSTPFGQPAATSTPFGQQPATSTPFGQTATSTPFGQAPTSTPATGGFGGFGQAATATSTPFGQQPGTSTAFGQAPTSTAATSGFGGFGPSNHHTSTFWTNIQCFFIQQHTCYVCTYILFWFWKYDEWWRFIWFNSSEAIVWFNHKYPFWSC